ncbi:MAG: Rieske 2Fe-2S domain-containing protein [Hormoscilla sp. GUM202]|nr:Rieske 2Fe-2S domain-containing protein [Hormoscilla sp. GUM202]
MEKILQFKLDLNNLLIIYGEDKQLRAFHNLCRHRGTQLLRAVGKGKKFITCPYHDWTYTLEGELSVVPDRKSQFSDLDMSQRVHLTFASVTYHILLSMIKFVGFGCILIL